MRSEAEGGVEVQRDADYLQHLGDNVRALRAQREVTRKVLAQQSGVSERFLAQLEGGTGNASVLVLRRIAVALNVELEVLLAGRNGQAGEQSGVASNDLIQTVDFLRGLAADDVVKAKGLLRRHFGATHAVDDGARRQRIALIGLRGAGKSTLGARLAQELKVPFIELDRLVEKMSGTPLSAIFDLYGQTGFRRFERRCLDEVLAKQSRFVIATGGSIVSEAATFDHLLRECYTIWLRATPEEHMQRVIAQGDMRPMAHNPEAMSELKQILREREPVYRKADLILDTSRRRIPELASELLEALSAQRV